MNIKRIKMLSALLIPVILYGILFFTLREPLVVNNSVEYCEEIAGEINKIGLKKIVCEKITEEDGILFEFDVKNWVKYDSDTIEKDVSKVRNYLIRYVTEHPENPLSEKDMIIEYPFAMRSHGNYSYTYINVFE